MNRISRFATTVLVSGGLGLAGLGLGADIAHAGGPTRGAQGMTWGAMAAVSTLLRTGVQVGTGTSATPTIA